MKEVLKRVIILKNGYNKNVGKLEIFKQYKRANMLSSHKFIGYRWAISAMNGNYLCGGSGLNTTQSLQKSLVAAKRAFRYLNRDSL